MSQHTEFFRNAIDLNRYSNGVARRIVRAYNDVIIDAVDRLSTLDPETITAARLRAILVQLKESLDTWAGSSALIMTEELQGLALLQADFMVDQLEQIKPPSITARTRSVEISPQFAQAVVTSDPTQMGIISLSDDLPGAARSFARITVADGTTLTLPNGEVIRTAFANMSKSEAQMFGQVIRNGLLTGDSLQTITRRIKGRVQKGDTASLPQLAQKGGALTVRPNNQIRAIVRSSITQVTDAAREQVARENPEVTRRYIYRAVLDSRTTPICRSLDGKVYQWGKGPEPPLHFGCRSLRAPLTRGLEREQIAEFVSYGDWLQKNPDEKAKVFGRKTAYFDFLAKEYGPNDALRRFVSRDGSELTLKELASRYPNVRPRVPSG